MPLKITPLGDRLIVKPIDEQHNELLITPDSAKAKPQKGRVIEVGPGLNDKPLVAKKGDIVFYKRGFGIPIPDGYYPGETDLIMMTEGVDTLMVISETEQ